MSLGKAIMIAIEAHYNQWDLGDQPYILHPLRVMVKMNDADSRIIAVLHDVLEDNSYWTIELLRSEGFSELQLEALDALTRRRGEEYWDYIKRVERNKIARLVKLADLEDNMNLDRLGFRPTDADWARRKKYEEAWEYLRNG